MSYNKKYVISGDKMRVLEYSKPVSNMYKIKRSDFRKSQTPIRLDKSLYRTRMNIKDSIDSNITQYSKFITLTFEKDIQDRNKALEYFKAFTKRYKKHYKQPLKYVAIMELQTGSERHQSTLDSPRMVWHFHLISFNDFKLDLKEFEKKVWQYGITNTKRIDKVDNIGLYLMKYITKDFVDKQEKHSHLILKSQSLKKPVIKYGLNEKQPIIDIKKKVLTYKSDYSYTIPERVNKFTGEILKPEKVNVKLTEYTIQ